VPLPSIGELLVLQRATKEKECSMIESILSRRHFNRSSLIPLLAAMGMPDGTAAAQQQSTSHAATRRDVIKQELPGHPIRRQLVPHRIVTNAMTPLAKVGEEAEQMSSLAVN
jgi:hypothetical protein